MTPESTPQPSHLTAALYARRSRLSCREHHYEPDCSSFAILPVRHHLCSHHQRLSLPWCQLSARPRRLSSSRAVRMSTSCQSRTCPISTLTCLVSSSVRSSLGMITHLTSSNRGPRLVSSSAMVADGVFQLRSRCRNVSWKRRRLLMQRRVKAGTRG